MRPLQGLRIDAHAQIAFLHPKVKFQNQQQFIATLHRPSTRTITFRCLAASSSTMEEAKKISFGSMEAAMLVEELRENFKSGQTRSYEWRVSQLKAIEKMVNEKEKDILQAVDADLAKPELEAFLAEITLLRSACKLALKDLKSWMKPQKAKTSMTTYPSSAEIVPEPLGVVLVISTWNFPFLLSVEPLVGAIAAGNAVVLKPSEIAPATSALLSRLFDQYLDKNFIRVVEGAVPETTALLEQKWDKILYTGSSRVGRIVMAAAAKHLTPVILELGGKCPAIVDPNTNLEVTAKRIIAGKWLCNAGQACIGVDYVITTKAFAPKLIDALKKALEEFFGENPLESKDFSRIVSIHHFRRLLNLLEEDKVSKKIVLGGQMDEKTLRVAPTILLDVPHDTLIMQEEIFGPLLPIVTVEKVEESFDFVNARPKPLAAYLFTNDNKLKKNVVQNLSTGGMTINDTIFHVTVPSLPFGGVGESGMGSYHGKYSFDAFSHNKSVMYREFAGDASVRYPPYTPRKQAIMKALIAGGILGIIRALLGW